MGRRILSLTSLTLVAGLCGDGAFDIATDFVATSQTARAGEPKLDAAPKVARLIDAGEIELVSTATADVTKRVAEHLRVQRNRYRLFLPPRSEVATGSTGGGRSASPAALRVRLSGTLADYRAALAARGLRVENPACYVPAERLILLGFDGARFDGALAASRDNADKLEETKKDEARRFAALQKQEEARFKRENVAEAVRKDLSRRRWNDFRRAQADVERRHKGAEEKNEQLLTEATDRLLSLASHELFHAYVDGEVYPRSAADLPPWLDEGLAQLVEHALWRNDAPLFDPPPPALVRSLREEKKQGEPPSVAEILALEGKHYLVAEPEQTAEVRRRYAFAWGLVQLLAETKRLSPRESLDRYVADREPDPAKRLARLTKKTPAEFETEWREYLARIVK